MASANPQELRQCRTCSKNQPLDQFVSLQRSLTDGAELSADSLDCLSCRSRQPASNDFQYPPLYTMDTEFEHFAADLSAFNHQHDAVLQATTSSSGPRTYRDELPSAFVDSQSLDIEEALKQSMDPNITADDEELDQFVDPNATADEYDELPTDVPEMIRQVQRSVLQNDFSVPGQHGLLDIPEELQRHRERLFELIEPITLSAAEYKSWWPWVERFWTLKDSRHWKNDPCISHRYRCRLFRKQLTTKGEGKRNKLISTAIECPVTMTVVEHFTVNGDVREPVQFVLSKTGRAATLEHNHDIPTLDDFKRSRSMLETAAKYVSKGFRAADVFRALRAEDQPDLHQLFLNAGGGPLSLKDVHNAAAGYRRTHPDIRLGGNKTACPEQVLQLLQWCSETGLPHLHVVSKRRKDGEESQGVAFGSPSRLKTLRRRGWLTLCDATHDTNTLGWRLFTLMIRDEHCQWIPGGHFLAATEDTDTIRDCFLAVQQLTKERPNGNFWQPRFMLTDDSAAEQLAVKEAFSYETDHILCHKHLDATLRKRFQGPRYQKTLGHLLSAVKQRRTKYGFEQSCLNAIHCLPGNPDQDDPHEAAVAAGREHRSLLDQLPLAPGQVEDVEIFPTRTPAQFGKDRTYIQREIQANYQLVAFGARCHSMLLLQVTTTNALESFHAALKYGTKDRMAQFTLKGAAVWAMRIAQRYEDRAGVAARNARRKQHPRVVEHPWLSKLPYPAQVLVADEIKYAEEEQGDDFDRVSHDSPAQCTCRFFVKYSLPCRHIWGHHLAFGQLRPEDFDSFAALFEDCGFEVYEGKIKDHLECIDNDRYARQTEAKRLEVRDIFYGLQQRYYDLEKELDKGDPEEKQQVLASWLQLLNRQGSSVTTEAARRALGQTIPLPEMPPPIMSVSAQLPPSTPLSTAIPRPSQPAIPGPSTAPQQASPSRKPKGKKRMRAGTTDTG